MTAPEGRLEVGELFPEHRLEGTLRGKDAVAEQHRLHPALNARAGPIKIGKVAFRGGGGKGAAEEGERHAQPLDVAG